jgi:hypothetical protein
MWKLEQVKEENDLTSINETIYFIVSNYDSDWN